MSYFNLYGPINDLGYGIAVRGLIRGLYSLGNQEFYLSPIGGRVNIEDQSESSNIIKHSNSFLWKRNCPSVAMWHEFDLNKFSGNKLIAYPIFETTEFDLVAKNYLKQMDGILVMSDWAREIVINNIGNSVPTFTVPCSANIYETKEGETEDPVQKNSAFTFLFIGKYEQRKSPLEIIQAYLAGFQDSKEDTRLFFHCFNHFDKNFQKNISSVLTRLGMKIINSSSTSSLIAMKGSCIVEVPMGRISAKQISQLYKFAHVGLFPSKAEGWNLPLMEAIQSGLPCIATDYSAHTQYLNKDYGYNQDLLLKKFSLETANDGIYFHGNRGKWAVPDQIELTEKLIYVHKNYKNILDSFDNTKIKETFTWTNMASTFLESINVI